MIARYVRDQAHVYIALLVVETRHPVCWSLECSMALVVRNPGAIWIRKVDDARDVSSCERFRSGELRRRLGIPG